MVENASRSPRASEPVDRYVGSQIAARRMALGLSQTALAERVGVSFQQVQRHACLKMVKHINDVRHSEKQFSRLDDERASGPIGTDDDQLGPPPVVPAVVQKQAQPAQSLREPLRLSTWR